MINIEVNNKTYKVPNRMDEFTIRNYQDVISINSSTKKYDKVKTILHVLSGVPKKHISKQPWVHTQQIVNSVLVMLNTTPSNLQKVIKVKDKLYHFEDNLDNIRYDQWSDLVDLTDDTEKLNNNLHIIYAILYREVISVKKDKFKLKHLLKKHKRNLIYKTKDYDSSVIMEQAELFQEELTYDVVSGVIFFFLTLKAEYLKRLKDSLIKEEEMKKEQEQS